MRKEAGDYEVPKAMEKRILKKKKENQYMKIY